MTLKTPYPLSPHSCDQTLQLPFGVPLNTGMLRVPSQALLSSPALPGQERSFITFPALYYSQRHTCWAWRGTLVISALKRLRQEGFNEFEASLATQWVQGQPESHSKILCQKNPKPSQQKTTLTAPAVLPFPTYYLPSRPPQGAFFYLHLPAPSVGLTVAVPPAHHRPALLPHMAHALHTAA